MAVECDNGRWKFCRGKKKRPNGDANCKVSETDPPAKMQMRLYVWWSAGSVSMARMRRFNLAESCRGINRGERTTELAM
jgi:hypothetical protein